MPAVVRKSGDLWLVKAHAGRGAKTLGKHRLKRAAERQRSAVNIKAARKR